MIALANAVVAKVDDVVTRVYKIGGVPASPPMPYTTVAASFDAAESYTLDADHGVGVYRITTQSVSSTYDGAADVDAKARGVLLDQYVTADGRTYGPGELQVGSAVVRDPDGGSLITITSTYLFRSEE